MARELLVSHTSGTAVYAVVRAYLGPVNIGRWFNDATAALEAFAGANWVNYAVALAELGTTGLFEGDMPAGLGTEDDVEVIYLERLGVAAAMTDTKIAGALFHHLPSGWTAVEALRV